MKKVYFAGSIRGGRVESGHRQNPKVNALTSGNSQIKWYSRNDDFSLRDESRGNIHTQYIGEITAVWVQK